MEYDTADSALLDVFDLVVWYKHHALILRGITATVSTKLPERLYLLFLTYSQLLLEVKL